MSWHTENPEVWVPIPGYMGLYEASSWGRIRSLPRSGTPGKVLNGVVGRRGYHRVTLHKNDTPRSFRTNRLIALAFHGEPKPGQVCRHLNDVKLDNRAVNLAWGTQKENVADLVAAGRHHHKSKTHCKNGHEFTPQNTHIINADKGGHFRRCRMCAKAVQVARRRSAA